MAEQQTKTVIEWLEQAKADGYEWAQSAIEQVDKDRYYPCDSLSEAVRMFAHWDETKEGEDFWGRVNRRLCGLGL